MTFQLKIQLLYVENPEVWRRIEMSAHASFSDLHRTIQAAFGWNSSHLYSFSDDGYRSSIDIQDMRYADNEAVLSLDADKIEIWDIFKGEGRVFKYVYDFGDYWEHEITLEKMIDKTSRFPVCTAGGGKCPPEDCGGTGSYEELKQVMQSPSDPEYEDFRVWLGLKKGKTWDPHEFEIEKINTKLKKIKTR